MAFAVGTLSSPMINRSHSTGKWLVLCLDWVMAYKFSPRVTCVAIHPVNANRPLALIVQISELIVTKESTVATNSAAVQSS